MEGVLLVDDSTLVELNKIDHHIALITLKRIHAANALSLPLLDQLNQVINDIIADHTIYCVIVTGAGEKSFCAGADLKERKNMNEQEVITAVTKIDDTVRRLEQLEVPVIAAINGVAFGGGLELALACDFRIAANTSKLGLTETSFAIIPGAGGTQRLPRAIGLSQAKRLIYTAQAVDASEALQIGLVEQITNPAALLDVVKTIASSITKNGPIAVREAKKAINLGINKEMDSALKLEQACYLKTIPTKDRLEGLKAFQEKRTPNYQGE